MSPWSFSSVCNLCLNKQQEQQEKLPNLTRSPDKQTEHGLQTRWDSRYVNLSLYHSERDREAISRDKYFYRVRYDVLFGGYNLNGS